MDVSLEGCDIGKLAEFFYLIEGTIRNQGQELTTGDGYVAASGSTHADFGTTSGATYLSIFKL